MTGCQKHIVEPDVQEVYIEKIDTNQKYQITCKEEIHDIVQNINSGHRELAAHPINPVGRTHGC